MITAESRREPLGRLMVEAGLLSSEGLDLALAEQARSGRRLGEVIVALGLASHGAVANALAEQNGAPLRTEHGFAIGLGGGRLAPSPPAGTQAEELPKPREEEQDEEVALLRRRVADLQGSLLEARRQLGETAQLRSELEAAVAQRDEALGAMAAETRAFASRLVQIANEAAQRVAELVAERDELAARLAGAAAPRPRNIQTGDVAS
jgi:hypothetical protein